MQGWRVYVRGHPQFGPWYQRVESKPGWVWKAAITATLLVIVVPLILLTLAAVLVGVLVFACLGLVAAVMKLITGGLSPRDPRTPSPHDGRQNVRVIDPDRT